MSLIAGGNAASVVGNGTAGAITYQSLSAAENPNEAIVARQVLLKIGGNGDFKISQLSIDELGDVFGGDVSYVLMHVVSVVACATNTVFPPTFEMNDETWTHILNLPLCFQSVQMTDQGVAQLRLGDGFCMGGNAPRRSNLDFTIGRRNDRMRLEINYPGLGEDLPVSQTIDAAIPPGFDPYILLTVGVFPYAPVSDGVEVTTPYTFTPNTTPFENFNGLKEGFYLDGLVIDEGKFKPAPHMEILSEPRPDLKAATYGNTLLADGERIRYSINTALSNCRFTFGLRANDYIGVGNINSHNPLWDGNSFMGRRVFDALTYRMVDGTMSRDDPQWTMEYGSGPDANTSAIQPGTVLDSIEGYDFVVCRIGDQYIRYLEDSEGIKHDLKRFNQLPAKVGYQVLSFLTIDAYPAAYTVDSNPIYVPEQGYEVAVIRETIPVNERTALLALPSSQMYDEKIEITPNYSSKMVDERGSISLKPGMSGQVMANFPINLGISGFFELEFDPSDRNKSYYLQLNHGQPGSSFDYMLVSIHSVDGIEPHQLRVAKYLGEDVVFEQEYGSAAWNNSVARAGVILSVLSQNSGYSFLDVMRHTPSPDGYVPLNEPFAVYLRKRNTLTSVELTIMSHSELEPGSWLCNYNKSDFRLKKTWLGYAGERLYFGSDIHYVRHLEDTWSDPVPQGNDFTGTIGWKILPETSGVWHREEPPEGGLVENDSETATGLKNFYTSGSLGLNSEQEAPFAAHANARFYIVNNPVLAVYLDSFGTNTTYWRTNATMIRNVGNVIYLDEYDHCAEIISRTTLATISGSDSLDNYRFNWKTVESNGVQSLVCRLMRNGQVLWTSPNYQITTASEVWGKYIAVFYEVNSGFDMSNGYVLPDTQYKIIVGATE